MALGILFIFYLFIGILAINSLFLLFFKNGILGERNVIFGIIIGFTLSISFITYSSLPSNYILEKIIVFSTTIIAIISILIKRKSFKVARLILAATIILNFLLLIFIM